jgi:hypothetical protein
MNYVRRRVTVGSGLVGTADLLTSSMSLFPESRHPGHPVATLSWDLLVCWRTFVKSPPGICSRCGKPDADVMVSGQAARSWTTLRSAAAIAFCRCSALTLTPSARRKRISVMPKKLNTALKYFSW